ncbi:hypothetical protein EDD98_7714 [Streptomyces sp. PanSC19]|uniref:hypothetical protein n=1 Tax=Streptomyces sp. PanSC19 TaxID=1520455 RepID=UPI000F47E0CF|nr:hypothetical protein [Streptomyces sp. PanSC19]MCZ0210683.1 hypothetical protein [Streptomyces sp. UMAF16]ROQ23262.1 hypothetical protein EDD98_7714 [Streptomyces sp. PanSC19]
MTAPVWSGVVPMTPDRYAALARLASPWLEEFRCCPLGIEEDSGREERAVYIVVSADGMACYAGRTRPTRPLHRGAAVVRLRRHRTGARSKREEWARYWVLPLRPDTPDEFVDRLERTVQARLGLPRQNRRWRRT